MEAAPIVSRDPAFDRRGTLVAVLVLIGAGFAAYANTLEAPFIFDDKRAILDNPSIRSLGALAEVLSPPREEGSGVAGRPMVNLSLAVNYALGGTDPRGYHLANLCIHLLASLVLFGVVRRTLVAWRPASRAPLAPGPATHVGLAVAGLWLLHPLQTESVTCVIQRTESLLGLFFLLCLYAAVRSATATDPGRWRVASVAAAFLGMATKEVMVVAPVLVLLHDRTFLAGSFAGAWRLRRNLHLGVASAWLLLAVLLVGGGGTREQAAGFGLGVTPWTYLLTQCEAIVTYLGLALWPARLVLDYGTHVVPGPAAVWWQGLAILALLGGTTWALRRRPALGFLGAWFFVILAPSSSVVPLVAQTIAEHRMYLPLAALCVLAVAAIHAWMGRWALPVCLALAVGLGARTVVRNRDYATEVTIWSDTVAKRPRNVRALNNLGFELVRAGRPAEGIVPLREALRLDPALAAAHFNLGNALVRLGRLGEATDAFRAAVQLNGAMPSYRLNWGVTLALDGRRAEAMQVLREMLQRHPDHASARLALGQLEREPAAIRP